MRGGEPTSAVRHRRRRRREKSARGNNGQPKRNTGERGEAKPQERGGGVGARGVGGLLATAEVVAEVVKDIMIMEESMHSQNSQAAADAKPSKRPRQKQEQDKHCRVMHHRRSRTVRFGGTHVPHGIDDEIYYNGWAQPTNGDHDRMKASEQTEITTEAHVCWRRRIARLAVMYHEIRRKKRE